MREAIFNFHKNHIKEQFKLRYPRHSDRFSDVIGRLKKALRENTPYDWRFTESPTSRFFILEEETEAKFLGVTYRTSAHGEELLEKIQNGLSKNPGLAWKALKEYAEEYIEEILDPTLTVVHDIRTVYGKGIKAHISEEKHVHQKAYQTVGHIVPLVTKKIAARPNVIIFKDESLWVRQYLNWVCFSPNSEEYYLFQKLTRNGVQKNTFRICSYTQNGRLRISYDGILSDFPSFWDTRTDWKDSIDQKFRTENYWKLPTIIDARLIDLDFKERYAEKGSNISGNELLELYFLRKMVGLVRQKFNL